MKVALTSGAYKAKSVIANAQRCINLYPEQNPQDAPFPYTFYPTPGTTLLGTPPTPDVGRGLYTDSQGNLYAVIGANVYYISPNWNFTLVGSIVRALTPVSMADNGLCVCLVDGSTIGYAINIADRSFGAITDPSYLGASKVDYVDTFFIFNQVNTNGWFISLSNATFTMFTGAVGSIQTGNITNAGSGYINGTYNAIPFTGGSGSGATANVVVAGGIVTSVTIVAGGSSFVIGDVLTTGNVNLGGAGAGFAYTVTAVGGQAFNSLNFATKTGYPDPITGIQVVHRELWLIGQKTTEIWYNSGSTFPFAIQQGAFIEHGSIATFSIASEDLTIFWLSQDKQGQRMVLAGSEYAVKRVSTHAIEQEFQSYSKVNDAVGYCYQQNGHVYYVLHFPTANTTWVYDATTELWHQRAWTDKNGNLNRHRGAFHAYAYGTNVVLDWQTGRLLALNPNVYTDYVDGTGGYTDGSYPISRIRGWPHLIGDGKRMSYTSFQIDMECGNDDGSLDGTSQANPPMISMRWSNDKGRSFTDWVSRPMGAVGQFNNTAKWWRLGMARDRVFETMYAIPASSAINGAYVDAEAAET
jgi:hypothetical protein